MAEADSVETPALIELIAQIMDGQQVGFEGLALENDVLDARLKAVEEKLGIIAPPKCQRE